MGDTTIPSISERKIRVPLIFWFNRNYSLALPLVALQYAPVVIEVELRKIADLYTVIDIDNTSSKFGCRIKPSSNIANYSKYYSLVNFVNDGSISSGVGDNRILKNFNIEIYLDVNYIFLDSDEMKKFAQNEHKYLIQQVKLSNFKGSIGSDTLELLVHNPTSFMIVTAKRSDVEDRNEWSNYTNWINEIEPPWSNYFSNPYFEPYYSQEISRENMNDTNYIYRNSPYILKNMQLKLNGTDRFASQEQDFFSRVMPYKYAKRMPKKGILMYSFAVNPLDHQPSGSCNFSRFNSIELFLETQDVPKPTGLNDYMYKYDINVYTVNYNILRIMSGMGNLEFSN